MKIDNYLKSYEYIKLNFLSINDKDKLIFTQKKLILAFIRKKFGLHLYDKD